MTIDAENAKNPGEPPVLRYVSWPDLFPGLLLLRTVRLALRVPMLVTATVAVLLMPVGWRIGERLFLDREEWVADPVTAASVVAHRSWAGWHSNPEPVRWDFREAVRLLRAAAGQVAGVFVQLTQPFREAFAWRAQFTHCAYFLFGGLWNLALWAFAGGVITRLAGIQLARDVRLSWREGLRHAARHYLSHLTAPLYPLAGIVFLTLPLLILGFALRLDAVALVAAIFWPLALLGGLVMAILLLGLLFAWPLMWPVVSLEEQGDAFEALSRSYSYTLQRPLHYLTYALIALVMGAFGTVIVHVFVEAVIMLTKWGAGWGAGNERTLELWGAAVADPSRPLQIARTIFGVWHGLLRTVAVAFPFAFFWCAASGIYLLLRRATDDTALDEVLIDEADTRYAPSVPPAGDGEA